MAVEGSQERRCSSCGAPPWWLVTVPYSPALLAGRLLLYCDECRRRMAPRLGTVIPISLLDQEPGTVLRLLYRSGATESEPDVVAEMVGVPPGAWSDEAKRRIDGVTASDGGFDD